MAQPYRHLAALRAALLADTGLQTLGVAVVLAYPWGTADASYPCITIWQEADRQAVTLPRTNDPARVRVDAWAKGDADDVAQIYERLFLALHKQEQEINAVASAASVGVIVKECRQDWNQFPVWDAKLQAWTAPSRFIVRAMTLG